MIYDVVFPVLGETLPTDHTYHLYGAIAKSVPVIHAPSSKIRFSSITGLAEGNGEILITKSSILRFRSEESEIKSIMPLAGKALVINLKKIYLGVPSLAVIEPCAGLYSSFVTFKNAMEPNMVLKTAAVKLTALGIKGTPTIPVISEGVRQGEPMRRVLRIKGFTVVGYSLIVSDLSDKDSVILQEVGLGGKTKMGCGFFFPQKETMGK